MVSVKKLVLLFISFWFLFGFFSVDVKPDVDKSKVLKLSTRSLLSGLLQYNYAVVDGNKSKDYLLLQDKDYKDVYIRIYAQSLFSMSNAIILEVPVDGNEVTKNNNEYYLAEHFLSRVKEALFEVPCAKDSMFLKSGFNCDGLYSITYTLYENNTKEFFGGKAYKKLLVKIMPLTTTKDIEELLKNEDLKNENEKLKEDAPKSRFNPYINQAPATPSVEDEQNNEEVLMGNQAEIFPEYGGSEYNFDDAP
jgi:hypothetical protein